MAEKIPGDEEFQKFLDDGDNDPPVPKGISIILYSLKEKIRQTVHLYNSSLEHYSKLEKDDPMKKILLKNVKKFSEESLRAISQFDYVLIDGGSSDGKDI